MSDKRDVFISYRRDGGATVARMLAEILKTRGVSVFFDAETLGSGDFTAQIEAHLKDVDKVILVVSPGLFDRCGSPDDWVRKEIEFAIINGKTLIPVFVNGANGFPDSLPKEIRSISNQNGIEFGHANFDESISKLIDNIKTRKDQMIDAFFDIDENPFEYDTLINSLEDFYDLFDESTREWRVMCNSIYSIHRKAFKSMPLKSKDDLAPFFNSYGTDIIKDVCKNLRIDDRGDRDATLESIWLFLSHLDLDRPDSDHEEDRLDVLISNFKRYHLDSVIEMRNEIVKEFGVGGSSLEEVVRSAIYKKGAREVLHFFDEAYIVRVAEYVLDNPRGRKSKLIEDIVDYVNYKDQA